VQSYARRLGVVTGRDERSNIGLGSGDGIGGGDGSGDGGGGGGDAISSRGFNATATFSTASASAAVETTNKLHLLTASPGELARGVGVAAASGGMVHMSLLAAAQAATQISHLPQGCPKARGESSSRLGAEEGLYGSILLPAPKSLPFTI